MSRIGKRTVSIAKDKNKNWWHKLKEILFEIAIIVFAITFSLWMHNRSEHGHQQEIVKNFLLCVKIDLQSDLTEMESDVQSLKQRKAAIRYLMNMRGTSANKVANEDSNIVYGNYLTYNSTFLIPNNGRYEGFKSSGQLGFIENTNLQNSVADYYQEQLNILLRVSEDLNQFIQNQFYPYLSSHLQLKEDLNDAGLNGLVKNDEFINLMKRYYAHMDAAIGLYNGTIRKTKEIIKLIDEEYK